MSFIRVCFVAYLLCAVVAGRANRPKRWCKTHQEKLINMTETIATFADKGVKCIETSAVQEDLKSVSDKLTSLRIDVAAANSLLTRMKGSLGHDHRHCAEAFWVIRRCDLDTHVSSASEILLDGTFSSSLEQCVAFNSHHVSTVNYEVSVDVFNMQGWNGVNTGHPGIVFNKKDTKSFDMIYLRPHAKGNLGCYQTGYLSAGKWYGIAEGACPENGPPRGGVWFNMRLEVSNGKATLYRDGKKVVQYSPHYDSRGRAGVFLWTGYNNIAKFKNFKIKSIGHSSASNAIHSFITLS